MIQRAEESARCQILIFGDFSAILNRRCGDPGCLQLFGGVLFR